jgi:hypothetical protein
VRGVPQFTYHRFWAQTAVATAMAEYDRLLGDARTGSMADAE